METVGNECVKGLGGKVILVVPALQGGNMDLLTGLGPLLALLIFAFVIVWRGMRRKPDGSHNMARGGGPNIPGSGG